MKRAETFGASRGFVLIPCLLLAIGAMAHTASAAGARFESEDPSWLLPLPEVDPDPAIPTLKSALGHDWGSDITTSTDIDRYLEALAAVAPDRARIETLGTSYEGRSLRAIVITSAGNLARLEEIRTANLRLADPRSLSSEEAQAIVSANPAILWMGYGIHGNETSSSDAALLTAYHLLADRRASTRAALEDLVVWIDPNQNPDGRERFLAAYREGRGEFPQAESYSSEHTERWPGGRFNHYLFDMNRDWFLQSQVESRARAAFYLRWRPQICIDAHEMGHDSHYFFDPSTDPVNPHRLPRQREWSFRLGRKQAEWFDRYGFPYTTREMFDGFYPGYGSEWPNMHGAIGVLWEQAGVRGLLVDRSDETTLKFQDAVRHHYVSGLATVEAGREGRADLLRDFHEASARGVLLGSEGPVRDVFLLEGTRPYRAAHLARVLIQNGIEVRRLEESARVIATDVARERKEERIVPRGSYHVPVAQPNGQAVRILLDREIEMGRDFVERQLRRKERRETDEIYDVTAWSLPLAFGVDCVWTAESATVSASPSRGETPEGTLEGGPAELAYLVPGDDDAVIPAIATWLRKGLRVHVTDRSIRLGERLFPRGTFILRVRENPEGLHEEMDRAAREDGLRIAATRTGFVTEGAHLGGPYVRWVRPPRILLAWDRPAGHNAGHTWYFFDQLARYPTTRVACRALERADLAEFDVVILPDGDYAEVLGEAFVLKLREWARAGGTLILVEGAAAWGSGEKVGLLASATVKKETPWTGEALETRIASGVGKPADGVAASREIESSPAPVESRPAPNSAGSPADGKPTEKLSEAPDAIPGAFLRARVFDDHWLTHGCDEEVDILVSGGLILKPLKPTDGRNLVTFLPRDQVLTSGFAWPETLGLIAGTPFLVHQPLGRGHVIGFATDPCFRAMYPAMRRFVWNAVFLAPRS